MLVFAAERCRHEMSQPQTMTNVAHSQSDEMNLTIAQEFLRHMDMLHRYMEADLQASDAKWTLFVAAVTSYRFDCLLTPCPKQYSNKFGRPAIEKLYEAISEMPKLNIILQYITNCNYEEFRPRSMDLLYWVLVTCRDPLLRTLQPDEYDTFYERFQSKALRRNRPTDIFEIHPFENNLHLLRYCELSRNCRSKVAFYGAPLDRIFSMLIKNELPFGQPLRLVTNIDEALKHSPQSCGWGGSLCGAVIKCIAVCEVLDCEAFMTTEQDPKNTNNEFVIVNNAQCLRMTYLIFFGNNCDVLDSYLSNDTIKRFMERHKYFITFSIYIMAISTLGMVSRGRGSIRGLLRQGIGSFTRLWSEYFLKF